MGTSTPLCQKGKKPCVDRGPVQGETKLSGKSSYIGKDPSRLLPFLREVARFAPPFLFQACWRKS